MSGLLVVAGEASGDRAAAAVVRRLPGLRAFGLGGGACAAAGVELLADLRASTAMGVGEAAARGHRVWRAWRDVARAARARRPRAALLVDYSEFNARLARSLHPLGVRVLWYGAPQVWAWRRGRLASLRPFVDRMAVTLPFEEPLWRSAGVDAHYVGHPALEAPALARRAARERLGLTPLSAAVGILPGSRPHEVRRLLEPMLDGFTRVRADRASVDARVLVAASLDAATRARVRATCARYQVSPFEVDPAVGASEVLGAFDAALCASGTASLEAAIAGAVPIVAYRVGLATELAGRILLRTPHVGLPNVLLGRRAFPELLQRGCTGAALAAALGDALDDRAPLVADCDRVAACLGQERQPSRRVADMLTPWLERGQRAA